MLKTLCQFVFLIALLNGALAFASEAKTCDSRVSKLVLSEGEAFDSAAHLETMLRESLYDSRWKPQAAADFEKVLAALKSSNPQSMLTLITTDELNAWLKLANSQRSHLNTPKLRLLEAIEEAQQSDPQKADEKLKIENQSIVADKIHFHHQVERDIQRLNHSVRGELQKHYLELATKSPASVAKHYKSVPGVWSYGFTQGRTHYRILFKFSKQKIWILEITTREGYDGVGHSKSLSERAAKIPD